MVRKLLIACALLSAMAAAQGAKPQTPSAKPQAPAATKPAPPTPSPAQAPAASPAPAAAPAAKGPGDDLPSTAPVITMKGLCAEATEGVTKPAPTSTKDACVSVMTKADFEKLVQAVNPTLPPAMRRNLAKQLVDLMTLAQAAEKAGMQNQPNFTEILRVQRLNVLGNLYGKSLEEQARNVPPAEIEAYYKSHLAHFEEVKLQRIYVPKADPSGKSNEPEKKAAWVAKAQQVADEMNNRAAKGEDIGTLQKETYTMLGIAANPPNIDIGGVRKGSLAPASEQAIALLKPGGVYRSDEPSAIVIYKVLSKGTLPQEAVKDEIGRTIFSERIQASRKAINDSVKADFDEKYFGPATPPLPPGATSPR